MRRLKPVLDPQKVWPDVKKGLKVVKEKAPGNWTIQQVYQDCMAGKAFLFTCPEGFCIVKPKADIPPRLHVWIAYGNSNSELSLLKQYEPEIIRLARMIDAHQITFRSPRKGYRRALRHWQRDGEFYSLGVTYE